MSVTAMTAPPAQAPAAATAAAPKRRSYLRKSLTSATFWRGIVAILVFLLLWEVGARSKEWAGFAFPFIGLLPPPSAVAEAWLKVLPKWGYWMSWYQSFARIMGGFLLAQLIGIPVGLLMAMNKYFRDIFFPPFEILRPIPPLAWVPASLIFWPTNEMSITFVTFLGAFFTIVINVLGGARAIDVRYLRAAQSMGATQWDLFSKIILPGVLPSIFIGASVGMGITWNVVLAAEMISGGGTQGGGGLGFFIWNSYMGGSLPQIVVGMISIGIAGYLSSAAIRALGDRCMPWLKTF
jgi:NitT/TauT family transport system permease protein